MFQAVVQSAPHIRTGDLHRAVVLKVSRNAQLMYLRLTSFIYKDIPYNLKP
jgi:hypothetical protein